MSGGAYTKNYSYRTINGSRSSLQVSSLSYNHGNSSTSFNYTYDENGNILSENDGNQTISYTYDGKKQLIATTKGERTDQYQYDQAGNLTYTVRRDWLGMIGIHNYYYENDSWGDLLTKYDYGPIAYEGQTFNSSNQSVTGTPVSGNPISYYNGSNRRYTMSWSNGSQLSTVQIGGTNIEYLYDCDGIRKAKTVNGVTWNYITQSGKLVRAKSNDVVLDFIYDNLNDPYAVNYSTDNGSTWETFYYVRNFQGDIIKILNASGEVVARYKYDSWGLSLGIDDGAGESIAEDSIGKLNPLRYRGYIYDVETGFYYLNSRYYDPEIARFINSDSTEIIEDLSDFDNSNIFVYCNNNPIEYDDHEGNEATLAERVIVVVLIVLNIYAAGYKYTRISKRQFGISKSYWNQHSHKKYLGYSIVSFSIVGMTKCITKTIKQSKGGKQRIKDSGLANLSDAEISRRARDRSLTPKERKRYVKEEKARKLRDRKKRQSCY